MQLFRRLLDYALHYKTALLLSAIGMAGMGLTQTGIAVLTQPLMDEGFVKKEMNVLFLTPIAFVGLALLRGMASFIGRWSIEWVGRRVIFDMRKQLFDRMIRLPAVFFDRNTSSKLIAKLIYDVEQLSQAATSALFIMITDSVTVISLLAWMSFISWKLTLIFIVIAPALAYLIRSLTHRFRQTSKNIQDSMGGITKVAQEATVGQRVIKAFTAEDYESHKFDRANNVNRQQVMKQITIVALGNPIVELIVAIAIATIITLALYESIHGTMTEGQFVSYISSLMLLLSPAKRLTNTNHTIQRGLAAAQSAFAVLDEAPEPDTGTLQVDNIQGHVEFCKVNFSYHETSKAVLHDISFVIEPGTTVALVGASGSGKSTLANLLARFYLVEQGEIRIDGHNINDYRLENLRQHVALISQETVLFDDTIRNNICYGHSQNIDESHLQQAIDAAHVREFVERLPEGLDTQVGEKGMRLSGGQRQRIAIARAIYKNAPILIMDEATSALDTESERHVQAAMDSLMQNRSSLVIAHRLSTIEKAERIVVMSQGRVVEKGTHKELLSKEGVYAKLHQMQFAEDANPA